MWLSAISGAGFAVDGNDLSNRYKDVLQPNYVPDFIVTDMALGLNDTAVIATLGDAAYTARVQATLAAIRAGLEANGAYGVPIVVMGSQQGVGSLATQQRVDTAIELAVSNLADKRIAVVRNSLLTTPWIYGSGSSPTQTGTSQAGVAANDGNADKHKVFDKTHLTTEGKYGHTYVGRRAADEFVRAIAMMA